MKGIPNTDKMGYDRSITMFSPDGRLLQVEYAKKTVKQGSTAIGMICKEGVLLVADKRIMNKLIIVDAVEKVFKIDDHMAAVAAGIISDARVLVERAQVKAQEHKLTYDSSIDIISVVKDISDLNQICTQSGGLRPFGVSLIIGGIDNDGTPKIYMTDPTGIYFQYNACVIGEGDGEVEKILEKKYSKGMTLKEGLKLSITAMKSAMGKNFIIENADVSFINIKDKKLKNYKIDEIKRLLK